MKKIRKHHNYDEDLEFKITKNDTDWKFEFGIYHNSNLLIRSKIYSKTADKLTSLGVSSKDTLDPLAKLLTSYDK